MKYLKNAFDLYLNTSVHVALAVVAFTFVTYLEHGLKTDYNLVFFIFFASITGYNFVKYAGIAKLHHLSLAKNLRVIQIFSLVCFFAMLYFCYQLKFEVIAATAILGLFTLLYALPVFGQNKNLRSLPGIKIFIIALVWAGSTVLLPLINAERYLGIDLIVDFIQRLMLVIVLTVPFEIRDLNYDNESLGTIPQKIGVFLSKVFGSILLLLLFSSELFQKTFTSGGFLALFVVLVVTGIFLWSSKKKQGEYFASFWVEALPIGYLGIFYLIKIFLPRILS